MGIWIVALLTCSCAAGVALFRLRTIPVSRLGPIAPGMLSIIIPARNEERNLPYLLGSLQAQKLHGVTVEIIVVDDCSEDRTRAVAECHGVKTIAGTVPPPGWTGKNWAVWNGYLHAKGNYIAFLDADVRLAPHALQSLLALREKTRGAISVVPYHDAVKFYERLALIPNLLGLLAFTSPFERSNRSKGLYGSCIVTTREHYVKAKGHEGIKSEVLDDLNLGAQFVKAGIPVNNYIGYGMVSFRMYPDGIRSQVQGFSKGAILSTSKLSGWTTMFIAIWFVGLLAAEAALLLMGTAWALPLAAGYLLYTAQIYGFAYFTGRFGRWLPALHVISTVMFLYIMLYSAYQVVFFRRVVWKGRHVGVGKRDAEHMGVAQQEVRERNDDAVKRDAERRDGQ